MVRKEPIRQLIKFSNYSLCITLPKEYIDNLGWQQGDRISFKLNNTKNDLILSRESTQPADQTIKQPKGTTEIDMQPPKPVISPNIQPDIQINSEIADKSSEITTQILTEEIDKEEPLETLNNLDLEPIPPIS